MNTLRPDATEHLFCYYLAVMDSSPRRLQLKIKRMIDFVGAGLGLILISPILLALAILVRIESPGPIIFKQKRLGRYGRPFTIYKFRTMIEGAPIKFNSDGSTRVTRDDPRITRLGHFMRWTGLDELPQLVNVLKGEMSLVGPRADPYFYIQNYQGTDYCKLFMRPGITAWAHVLGRQTITWRDRFAIESEYIQRYSLLFDVKILCMTLLIILRRIGVHNRDEEPAGIDLSRMQSSPTEKAMSEF